MVITFSKYTHEFKGLLGGITAALEACPIFSGLLPEKIGRYLFPPLNDTFRIIALFLGIIVIVSVYSFHDLQSAQSAKGRMKWLGTFVGIALLGACFLFISEERSVRSIDIPTLGKSVAVSIGYRRTDFANTHFPNWSDWKILYDYGHEEEQISNIWTSKSIIIARFTLLVSYLLFLLSSLTTLSLAVLFQGLGDAPNP